MCLPRRNTHELCWYFWSETRAIDERACGTTWIGSIARNLRLPFARWWKPDDSVDKLGFPSLLFWRAVKYVPRNRQNPTFHFQSSPLSSVLSNSLIRLRNHQRTWLLHFCHRNGTNKQSNWLKTMNTSEPNMCRLTKREKKHEYFTQNVDFRITAWDAVLRQNMPCSSPVIYGNYFPHFILWAVNVKQQSREELQSRCPQIR